MRLVRVDTHGSVMLDVDRFAEEDQQAFYAVLDHGMRLLEQNMVSCACELAGPVQSVFVNGSAPLTSDAVLKGAHIPHQSGGRFQGTSRC